MCVCVCVCACMCACLYISSIQSFPTHDGSTDQVKMKTVGHCCLVYCGEDMCRTSRNDWIG